jgi:hypothetical protein
MQERGFGYRVDEVFSLVSPFCSETDSPEYQEVILLSPEIMSFVLFFKSGRLTGRKFR